MARKTKQKLSRERRGKLKRHLGQLLRVKAEPSVIRQTLSKKYGITTNTVDWYLKKAKENGKATAKAKKRGTSKTRSILSRNGHSNAPSLTISSVAQSLTKSQIQRALELKDYEPKLASALRQESELRDRAKKVNASLEAACKTTRKIRRQMRSLSGK